MVKVVDSTVIKKRATCFQAALFFDVDIFQAALKLITIRTERFGADVRAIDWLGISFSGGKYEFVALINNRNKFVMADMRPELLPVSKADLKPLANLKFSLPVAESRCFGRKAETEERAVARPRLHRDAHQAEPGSGQVFPPYREREPNRSPPSKQHPVGEFKQDAEKVSRITICDYKERVFVKDSVWNVYPLMIEGKKVSLIRHDETYVERGVKCIFPEAPPNPGKVQQEILSRLSAIFDIGFFNLCCENAIEDHIRKNNCLDFIHYLMFGLQKMVTLRDLKGDSNNDRTVALNVFYQDINARIIAFDEEQLQWGDMVQFMGPQWSIYSVENPVMHSMMYIGCGKYIHSVWRKFACIQDLTSVKDVRRIDSEQLRIVRWSGPAPACK